MAAVIEEPRYSTPQWLDRDFLQVALREGLRRGSLDINTYSIKPATKPGDNYLSQMFRMSANIISRRKSAEDVSFIIKSLPKGDATLQFISDTQMFTREIRMLSQTLPVMNKILEDIKEPKLCAELYFLQTDPEETLVLEDLCRSGFQCVYRLDFLDLPHSKLVVERLALFHAASLVAFQKNPSLKDDDFFLWDEKLNISEKFVNEGVNSMRACLKQWQILPHILEKFEKLDAAVLLKKLLDVTAPKSDELIVYNHGDPWTANIMFKYENQQPIDLRFVDFQISCLNSPVYDLLYFIGTSMQLDIRMTHVDEILETYHAKFAETCRKLNLLLDFTLRDLKKAYYEKLVFGFFVSIAILPFMSVPNDEVRELNDYLNSDSQDTNLDMYLNENFKQAAEKFLPYYLEHGMLD